MIKKRLISLFLSIVLVLTYCFGTTIINVNALSASDVSSLPTISSGQTKTLTISESGGYVAVSFTPTESGEYALYSVSSLDTIVTLYDSSINYLDENDDGPTDMNFYLEYYMTAGTTYVYAIRFWDDSVGSFDVVLEKACAAESMYITQGDSITGYVKDVIDLSVEFLPSGCSNEDVNWTSGNESVATVEAGVVTLLSPGTATITATSENGLKDTCAITVEDYSTIILGKETNVEITDNRNYDCLYYTPSTSGMYAFYSLSDSDTYGEILAEDYSELASDDNNGNNNNFRVEYQLTAGTKYILKSKYNRSVTGSFKVKIEKVEAAESISIAQGSSLSGAVGITKQLDICYSPENYITESITWTSSDTSVVTVSDTGKLQFLKEGTATVTATTDSGLTATCVITVAGHLGISEGEEIIVNSDVNNGSAVFTFSPLYDGTYAFYSYNSDFDTYGCIYDADKNQLAYNDDADDSVRDFYVTCNLFAGEIYYLECAPYYTVETGSYSVKIISLDASQSIKIEQGDEVLGFVDESFYLTVMFYPDNSFSEDITWKSGNEAIATVDSDGKVTLVGIGSAVITATTTSGLKDSCTIIVDDYPVLKLDEKTTVNIDGSTDDAYFCFTPEVTGKYVFYSSSEFDTCGYILSKDLMVIADDDDFAGDYNFKVICNLTAGTKYIMQAKFFNQNDCGDVTVCLSQLPSDDDISSISVTQKPTVETVNKYYHPFMYGLELTIVVADSTVKTVTLTEDNVSFVYSYKYESFAYEFAVDSNLGWIVPDLDNHGTYMVYYLDKSCAFVLTVEEGKDIISVELENVQLNADGMVINVTYSDNTVDEISMLVSTDYYAVDEDMAVGYGSTKYGYLYFKNSQSVDGNNVSYEVSILGELISVTKQQASNMPDNYVDAGTDFIAHIVTGDDLNGLGLFGVKADVTSGDKYDKNQLYYFVRQQDGSYKIMNKKTSYVLSLADDAAEGTSITSLPDAMSAQTWFIHYTDDCYVLRAADTDNLVLGISNNTAQLVSYDSADMSSLFNVVKTRVADYEIPVLTDNGILTSSQIQEINSILCNVSSECSNMDADALNQNISDYALEIFNLGVTDVKAIAFCINIRLIGGASEVSRILSKTSDYSFDSIYAVSLTDTGSQAGAHHVRNFSFYKICSESSL